MGKAVRDSGVSREEVFITSKLWLQDYGYEAAKKAGKIKSIGVSNMTPRLWTEFTAQFDTVPAVNQVECNPFFQQKELRKLLDEKGVRVEAWYPLGHGSRELLDAPAIKTAAEKYGKNAGQVILRFEVQEGIIALPKSTNPARIAGNIDIFDFELTDAEMESIRFLDTGKGTHDPEAPGVGENLATLKVHE